MRRSFAVIGRGSSEITRWKKKTRRAWQSQTWGRPAPQVRVQNQFQEDEIPLAAMSGRMKKFSENTSTIPEVMDSSTLNCKANFKFSRFFCGGGTPSLFGCVLVSLCQSLACVKISAPPKGRDIVSRKSPLGCTFIRVNNFYVCGPKYARFFSPNVGGVVDDQELFRFLICWCVPEIFAIEVKVVKNREKFWTIFWRSQIFEGGHCKNCTHFITRASRGVDWKKSCEDTPTSPEVIESNTLNFRPDF